MTQPLAVGSPEARAVCRLWSGELCATLPEQHGVGLLQSAMRVLFALSASRYDLWVSVPFSPALIRKDDVERLLVQEAHWTGVGVAYRLSNSVRIGVDEEHTIYLQVEEPLTGVRQACDLLLVAPELTGHNMPMGRASNRVNQLLLIGEAAADEERWLREFTPNGLHNVVRPVPLEVLLAGAE